MNLRWRVPPFLSVWCMETYKVKIQKNLIVLLFCLFVCVCVRVNWSLTEGTDIGWLYPSAGCWDSCFGPRGRERQEAGENCVMNSFLVLTPRRLLLGLSNEIWRVTCATQEKKRNSYGVLWNPKERESSFSNRILHLFISDKWRLRERPLGRPGYRCKDNIKWILKQWDGNMDWVDVAVDGDRCRALVRAVMKLWFGKGREFLD